MKLHLPKHLLAAVIIVACVSIATAETYYLNATPNGTTDVNLSESFRAVSEGTEKVAWQKFCSGQNAYDGPHQLIIDQSWNASGKIKIDFAPFCITGFNVQNGATGYHLYRTTSKDNIVIGKNGDDTQYSTFAESFTLEHKGNNSSEAEGYIQLIGTQTWSISEEKTVTLQGHVLNDGNWTISGGNLTILHAITNTGTVGVTGTIYIDDISLYEDKESSYSDTATGNGYATHTVTLVDGGTVTGTLTANIEGVTVTSSQGSGTVQYIDDTTAYWVNKATVSVGGDDATESAMGAQTFILNGGTLDIADGESAVISEISAKSDLSIGTGAVAAYKSADKSEKPIGAVTINGGTLTTQVTSRAYTLNIDSLTVGEKGATLGNGQDRSYSNVTYNANYKIASLQGEGDLTVYNMSTDGTSTAYINGGNGFTGDVYVQTRGGRMDLDIASETALQSSVIYLGGGSSNSTAETNIVMGNGSTGFSRYIKGIQDAEGRASSGNVICRSGNNVGTLVIDTGADNYSTLSGVKHAINLVKKGSGTQEFGGDMQYFGTNDSQKDTSSGVDGTVDIQGGKLAFTKDGGSMTVSSLSLTGGELEVAGTLTLNALTVDFSKYSTDTLSYTLVSAGTLNLGENVNLSTMTGTVDGYTGKVTQEGNSIVLTFALPDDGASLLVEGATLTGNVLALTVAGDLTGLSSVDLTLSDAALADIAGLTGKVSLTLTGTDGVEYSTIGDSPISVGFYNGAYMGEGNGMYRIEYIPEPASATLNLAALMMLSARRRRKH